MLAAHESRFVVIADEPYDYTLGGPRMATEPFASLFGAVRIRTGNERYGVRSWFPDLPDSDPLLNLPPRVAYRLHPLEVHPELLDDVSIGLRASMYGPSLIQLETISDSLFQELEQLTSRAVARFEQDGMLLHQPGVAPRASGRRGETRSLQRGARRCPWNGGPRPRRGH